MFYQRHRGECKSDSKRLVTADGQGGRVLGGDRLPRSGRHTPRLHHSLLGHPHPQDEDEAKKGAN